MRPEIVSKCLHLNLAVLSFKLSHIIERTVKKKRRIELKNKKQERIPKAFVKKKPLNNRLLRASYNQNLIFDEIIYLHNKF